MRSVKEVVFGEPIRDWGVVHHRERGVVTERCKLSLHRNETELGVVLNLKQTLFSVPNVWLLEIPTRDLPRFVTILQCNYDALLHTCDPRQPPVVKRHRMPASGRIFLKVIYGIGASRLLLDSKDPSTDGSFDIYGFWTRKSEIRILLANTYVTSNVGYVVSGDALSAVLDALLEFVDESSAASPPVALESKNATEGVLTTV